MTEKEERGAPATLKDYLPPEEKRQRKELGWK